MLLKQKEYTYDTVIVGSGAAAYNAAHELLCRGQNKIVLVTEERLAGTSRNAGSDKQTYYTLGLTEGDSVRAMAEALFAGGSVNGDTALAEAAGSAKSFYKLVQLGVPFPHNPYGEYVGYQTDHDQIRRATSAGPYTSRYMTQVLEEQAIRAGLVIHDHTMAVQLLKRAGRAAGLICLCTEPADSPFFAVYHCTNIIFATGGPASVYGSTVYPPSQTGALGVLAAAGVRMANLAEWQFGLSSLNFRWNVSGSYQQALPSYLSLDAQGKEHDFLSDAYGDSKKMIEHIFLKGYEWPFDVRKREASSGIDLLVYREIHEKKRRVFLDFTRNPAGHRHMDFSHLPEQAAAYLQKSGALFDTPVERLSAMNPQAVQLYREHGINLYHERLEIGLCAQHCNGGAWVDADWQTNLEGLYCVGEAAGTFGVYRPGGSALNAGQVGAMRAADHILYTKRAQPQATDFAAEIEALHGFIQRCAFSHEALQQIQIGGKKVMDQAFSIYRDLTGMQQLSSYFPDQVHAFQNGEESTMPSDLKCLFKTWDMLLSQLAVSSAVNAASRCNGSRGAGLVLNHGCIVPEQEKAREQVFITQLKQVGGQYICANTIESSRPIPDRDDWFEAVWRNYREKYHRML